jgi:(p)ppGpp synthase/HD superfamily hydrolase
MWGMLGDALMTQQIWNDIRKERQGLLTPIPDVYRFVMKRHDGQLYCGLPYQYHLDKVVSQLFKFGFASDVFVAAGLCHDLIEDTQTTREEVRALFGQEVEAIVWACTGIGKNRKERNADIYAKLKGFTVGCIVKVADRLANHAASISEPNTYKPSIGHLKMYFAEREEFEAAVRPYIPSAMWAALQKDYADIEAILFRSEHAVPS